MFVVNDFETVSCTKSSAFCLIVIMVSCSVQCFFSKEMITVSFRLRRSKRSNSGRGEDSKYAALLMSNTGFWSMFLLYSCVHKSYADKQPSEMKRFNAEKVCTVNNKVDLLIPKYNHVSPTVTKLFAVYRPISWEARQYATIKFNKHYRLQMH